ncbi:MAG: formate/nitrite transporter family protein [Oscillospiraceae bacterium]|nr:formate/nitrite transporter family protein [Oscillospiraceae bacterium]
MVKKIVSSLMCGMYISIGATVYISIGHGVAGAIFFAAGILMVTTYYNMLVTRVFAHYAFRKSDKEGYKISDMVISLIGNGVGCIIYSFFLSFTRYGTEQKVENLKGIVGLRLEDTYFSIFILAVICGFLVACACLTGKIYPDNKVASLGLSIIFIAVFVLCVPEHIVADFFFFSYYSFMVGFEVRMVPILLVVAAGNFVGGVGTGYLEYYRTKSDS